jgi:hypothetical protein
MLLLLAACGRSASDSDLDTDISVTPIEASVADFSAHDGILDEWEPALAASADGMRLVASWTEYPLGGGEFPLGTAFSDDGGLTWSTPSDLASPDGSAADSVLEALDDGFVLAWLDHGGAAEHIETAVATGHSFAAAIEASDPSADLAYDKPWLTAVSGDVLLTFQGDGGRTITGTSALSSDGATWQRTDIASDTTFRNLYYPCVSDTGRVWVTFYVEGAIGLRWSDDGGRSWTADDAIVADVAHIPFAEPECVAQGSDVWVVWGTSQDPDSSVTGVDPKLDSLVLSHTTDGVAFDQQDLPLGGHAYALAPQIVIEADGAIDVVFYAGDREGDTDAELDRVRVTDSVDLATWVAPVAFVGQRSSDAWVGDYLGLRWLPDGTLAAAYIDSPDGESHVSFVRTKVP